MLSYILCGIIILQYLVHHIERKDLYNRIMAGSLGEYKSGKVPSLRSAHDKVIRRWRGKGSEE